MNSLYKIITFDVRHGSCGGSLVQFQQGDAEVNSLPFDIGKVLIMSDIKIDDVRGNHAHHETEEILVALTGGCVVDLDDGKGSRESVRLSAAEDGGRRTASGSESATAPLPARGAYRPEGREDNSQSSVISSQSSDSKEAILLYPHIWRTMRDFEPNTTLMVVANIQYDEADYIRDRTEFERVSKHWKTLGGSATR